MNQGDYIKSLLRERNLSSKEMAKRMGLSTSGFSGKLHGSRPFKNEEIEILLRELDMTYEEVFQTKEVKIKENDEHVIILDGEKQVIPKEAINVIKVLVEEAQESHKKLRNINFSKLADYLKKQYDCIDKEELEKLKKERKARKEKEHGDDKSTDKLP